MKTQLNQLAQDMNITNTPAEVLEDRYMDYSQETDLTPGFWDNAVTVSDAYATVLNAARAAAEATATKVAAEHTQNALSIIAAKQMLTNLADEADQWLFNIVLTAALKKYYWWNTIDAATKQLKGTIIREAFFGIAGKDSYLSSLLEEATQYFKGFNAVKENGVVVCFVNKVTGDEYPVVKSDVNVAITSTGLRVNVSKGKTIIPTQGQEFKFKHGTSVTLGAEMINSNLKHVLQMVRIHNVYTKVLDKAVSDREVEVYTRRPYRFKAEDALVLAVLLKVNNISLRELFAHKKGDANKLLVLSRRDDEINPRSLYPVVCPAHTFPEAYAMSGVVSSSDAASGFTTKMTSVPRLVEFELEGSEYIVFTRENVGKVVARFDKLNNSKAIWTRKLKVFVGLDFTGSPLLLQGTAGGNILTPNKVLESDGACRVVSDMDHGGIKASYTPFQGIDSKLAKGDVCVMGANGFKGGMLAALGLVLGRPDFLTSLKPIVAAEAVYKALNPTKELPKNLLEVEEESSKNANMIQKHLLANLTTIDVAGVPVRGILVEIDVKITNTYTLDRLQFVEKSEDDLDEGTKALEEAKDSLKKLQNQLEFGTVSTNGLRAYVAERKSDDADDFSVGEFMEQGLEYGTLKRKSLSTRVIMQELQSIESWYGKDVAMSFFNELLEYQAARGFGIDKLYATQLIGFFEKDILNTITSYKLATILHSSNKGLVHNNNVYFKDTIQEVLEYISVHNDNGWLSVKYPNGSVDIPMGKIFTGDLKEQMENDKSYVVAKGLLADLLENVKSLLNEDGTSRPSAQNHLLMKSMVQKPLLGKNFGYQFAKGFYGVALPLVGNYGPTVVGITNRDRMIKSNDTFVPMAVSKAPQYFKGMTSSYNVKEMRFGYIMDLVLEAAIFMYTETFLAFLNDFDGDLARITVQGGTTLPFAELNYKEFNGEFFKRGYEDEAGGNYLKMKKARASTVKDYHKAVFESVTAKNNVGLYTANSYFYEAMIPNMVGETILSIHDEDVVVTKEMGYKLNSLLKMLIQVEAMDNVKQEGAKTFLSELLLNWNIRSLVEKKTEDQQKGHFNEIYTGLISLVNAYDMDLDGKEVSALVGLAKETAIRFPKEDTMAFNMFNARNINEKNKENIMKFIRGEDEELNTMFDFDDCAADLMKSKDTESMYLEVILGTAKALEESNFNIYVGDQG